MTPAINLIKQAKLPHSIHEYDHDPAAKSYGLEAATKLQVKPERVFKTLVVLLDGKQLAVGIIPVKSQLNMKQIAQAANAKKAVMADQREVERSTGYVLGGVSPLGQKKRLRTFLHNSARVLPTLYVSAGRRGLEIELSPENLLALTGGVFADLCQ